MLCVEGERLLEVTVQRPKRQTVPVGNGVTFRCTGYSRVSDCIPLFQRSAVHCQNSGRSE